MTLKFPLRLATTALLLMSACGGSPEPPPEPADEATQEAGEDAPATPDLPGLSLEDLKGEADSVALVPSPVETQSALEEAGIEAKLADLIPDHEFDMDNADIDHAAVRSGVVLADALLTVKTAESTTLVAHLTQLQLGLKQLGGGSDIDAMLNDMKDRIAADAVTRDELLKEFDELSGAVIPELKFNGQDRVVPLIQAGSWLEGANLVAKAIQSKGGDGGAADTLLKQPAVVDYFIGYVANEGGEKTPAAVTAKLQESLAELGTIAGKADSLTSEDIAKVIEVTDGVLALL